MLGFGRTPLLGKPAGKHHSTSRHRKGSSPSEIPDNAAVLIAMELFQAFTSAEVLSHAPGKVGLNSSVLLGAQRPPALN